MSDAQHTADELRNEADRHQETETYCGFQMRPANNPTTQSMLRAGAYAMDEYDKMATRFGESLETIRCLEARVKELEGALRWYSDGSNWTVHHPKGTHNIDRDCGSKARAALGEKT